MQNMMFQQYLANENNQNLVNIPYDNKLTSRSNMNYLNKDIQNE